MLGKVSKFTLLLEKHLSRESGIRGLFVYFSLKRISI